MSVSGRAIWMATGVPEVLQRAALGDEPVGLTLVGDGADTGSRRWLPGPASAGLTGRGGPTDESG